MHIESQREFLGVRFDNATYEDAARMIEALARSDEFSYVVTANVDHILWLHPEKPSQIGDRFRQAYDSARFRLCDSRILKLLARVRGVDLKVVTGSDLTADLFHALLKKGHTVAIVGGDEAMLRELGERFPGPRYLQHRPPMGVLQDQHSVDGIVEFVAAAKADIAFLAIGAPQSELVALACQQSGRCRGVGLCIGASIEFLLGRKSRAPLWLQQLSLEWAYRLLTEPRRLWKRYLVTGPRIFSLAWKWQNP